MVEIKKQAAEEVRKLKEESYDSLGRRYSDFEREGISERKRLAEAHRGELESITKEKNAREVYHSEKVQDVISTSNQKNIEMLSGQKEEFARTSAEQKRDADALKKYYETELSNEKYKNNRTTQKLVTENNSQSDRAINEQAKQYNEYIRKNREETQVKLNQKDDEIKKLSNVSDPTQVSLEARKKIDDYHYQRSSAELAEVNQRNQATVDALRDQNGKIVEQLHSENSGRLHELNRDLRTQYQSEKRGLERSYLDLESRAEMTESNLRAKHGDQQQRQYQKHAIEINQQEERHQESLKDQKAVLTEEKYREQEEVENKRRSSEREMTYKLNDTRREFEKKILDQQADHDREMQQVKFDFDKKLHEQERSSKRLLDERVKAYEFQLSHQEMLGKEQKRLLTEHYEEELDKVKRNHALISKSKS